MSAENKELLTAKEASDLLHINEKKVYSLAQEGKLPGTKITGKWIFPRGELEAFLIARAQQTLRKSFFESVINRKVILICGSDDPLLSVAQGIFHTMHDDFTLFTSSVGSGEGLRLLKDGFCHIAVSHLYDPETDDFSFPFLGRYFERTEDLVLVNLFYRNIGFVAKEVPVESFSQCVERGLRFVNRQRYSGIRTLADHMIATENLNISDIKGYGNEVFTHLDVIHHIMSGRADAGIATETVARSSGLAFSNIFEERFDMIVPKEIFFDKNIQVFVEFIRSAEFSDMIETMSGYNRRDTGKILYPKTTN
jgi:putative molybdopterin biosynthesis protein